MGFLDDLTKPVSEPLSAQAKAILTILGPPFESLVNAKIEAEKAKAKKEIKVAVGGFLGKAAVLGVVVGSALWAYDATRER